MPEAVVLEGLEAAVAARVLEESRDRPGHHRFTHVLVRDALYEGLGRSRRAALHGGAGRVLEARVDAGEEAAAALARHLAAAGADEAADRVLHYAVLAGDHARDLGAHHEAGDHYELALRALADSPDVEERRCELLLALGEARNEALERHRARPAFLEAARAALALGRPDLLVRAAHGYGYMTKAGETDGAAAALWREALAQAGTGAGSDRSVLLAASATASMLAGAAGADDLAAEALECARRSDDERPLAMALATRSLVLWGADAVEERLALATELLERGRARSRTGMALDGLELRGVPLLELGRVAAFDDTIEELLRLGGEVGKRVSVAQATQWRALRALMAGRFEEAERLAAEVLDLSGDAPNFALGYAAQLYATRRAQGRAEELLGGFTAYVDEHPDVPAWRALLAVAHLEAGRPQEAAAEFERLAASRFADVPRSWIRPVTLALAAECAVLLVDRERAADLEPLLAPRRGQLLVVASGTSCEGAVDRQLGALAAPLGNHEAAEVHFTAALALELSVGGHALAVRTRLAHARALLRGPGRAGARAAALLDAARTAAAELGMAGAVAEADALRAATSERPPEGGAVRS
ncbi:MAG: transcriptional regulator [Acidimicrobiales bacterium]|nr:transcriptional regulator [Acidimicrobiales bacterium]